MMAGDQYVFAVEGLTAVTQAMLEFGGNIPKNASMAINHTIAFARTNAVRIMNADINFPSGYLDPSNGRFTIGEYANPGNLEASIKARVRPTSLATFVKGTPGKGEHPFVAVRRDGAGRTWKKSGFLIKLRSGNSGALGNMGLAVRTKKGERPHGSTKAIEIAPGLWLLYGPSVDQAFRYALNRDDTLKQLTETELEAEFIRLMGVTR